MRINVNTLKILAASVSVFGLLACSADKTFNSATWTIHEPRIEHAGGQTRLSEALMNAVDLRTDDGLIFSEQDQNVTLTVTSKCETQKNVYPEWQKSFALRERFVIFEFIPLEAIFEAGSPLNKNIKCGFRFDAVNSTGSIHSFSATFAHIAIGSGNLPVAQDGDPLTLNNVGLLEIQQKEIETYSLPRLASGETYQLRCELQSGVARPSAARIHFDEFQMQSVNRLSWHSDLCRVFKTDDQGHLLAMSELISWRAKTPGIKVEKLAASGPQPPFNNGIRYVTRLPDFSYTRLYDSIYQITNMSAETVHIVVPVATAQPFEANFWLVNSNTYGRENLQSRAAVFETFQQTQIPIARFSPTNLKFDLTPGAMKIIEIGPLFDFANCNNGYTISDFSIAAKNGLAFHLVDDPGAELNAQNIAATIALEPAFTRAFNTGNGVANGLHEVAEAPPIENHIRIELGCPTDVKLEGPAGNKSADL